MDARGKRLIMIAGAVIILFIGVTAYFIFFKKGNGPAQSVDVNRSLFPFDDRTGTINNLPSSTNSQITTGELTANPIAVSSRARLRKITSFPISGFVSFTTTEMREEKVVDEKTNSPAGGEKTILVPITINHIRYNDQRTGHIFDGIIDESSILNTKLTKTDLPSAEELLFDSTGTTGLLRYEKDRAIETFKIIIPPPPTVPAYCTYTNITTDLKIGSRGAEVRTLQSYLNGKLGIKSSVDGVFGRQTAARVTSVQKTFSVAQTGVVDATTRTAIVGECTELQRIADEAKNSPIDLKGSLVPGNYSQIVRSPENTLFNLQRSGARTRGLIQPFSGGASTEIFNSPFNEWMPQFVNKNLVTLTSYASGLADGYIYGLNTTTGLFSKLFGPASALTTLTNPDGSRILATFAEQGVLVTRIINPATGAQINLPFVTLPEKCSWYAVDVVYCGVPSSFTDALYPDDWYKGLVGFSDSLWSYNTTTNRATQIAIPTESIDMFRMQSYPATGYLFFMNKSNYELWSYRISGND